MTLEHAFLDLQQIVEQLAVRTAGLQWAVDAVPESGATHALLDHYQTVVMDVQDVQRKLTAATAQGVLAVTRPFEYGAARTALIAAQSSYNALDDMLRSLGGEHAARDRRRLGVGLPVWRPWVAGVGDALEQYGPVLAECRQALFACWQSLSDRPPVGGFSVQAIGAGAIHIGERAPATQATSTEVDDD